ncbi:CP family cyanate transporter-like MFS transporter [Sphingomonas sp. UYAg733]
MDKTKARIVALWLMGVLAAAQLAKFSTLAPVLRQAFGLTLPEASLLISLLEIGGALFGFVTGLALGWVGGRRFLVAGLAILTAAGAGEVLASTAAMLFTARAVEGLGYAMVVTAAPTLIAATAQSAQARAKAMALWSTFLPVGIGLGSVVTGVTAGLAGPSSALAIWIALSATGLVAAGRLNLPEASSRQFALPATGAWLLTFGFGLYTTFMCGVTMLLPTFLTEQFGASIVVAGTIAGAVSFATLPGALIAMRVIGRTSSYRLGTLAVPALLLAAVLMPAIFITTKRSVSGLWLSGAVAILAVVLSGVARTSLFTRIPDLAGSRSPGDPRLAAAMGLLTQFGAAGALVGPPLGSLVVERYGWFGLGVAASGLAIALSMTLLAAERMPARESTSLQ